MYKDKELQKKYKKWYSGFLAFNIEEQIAITNQWLMTDRGEIIYEFNRKNVEKCFPSSYDAVNSFKVMHDSDDYFIFDGESAVSCSLLDVQRLIENVSLYVYRDLFAE